jgi:hypothetical protein
MGGVADFVRQVDPLGASIETSLANNETVQKLDPLGSSIRGSVFGTKPAVAGVDGGAAPYQGTQMMGRLQSPPLTLEQRNALLQSRLRGMPQGMQPGMMPMPLAWRQQMQPQMQPQMQRPTWDVNSYNPYQNMVMQRQQQQQPHYQNMGMFGQFNPFMPRR